jgi:GT2 family glycosyltransferase
MPGVTAIIPTWNRRDLLERLLGRLRLQTQHIEEVLVVDNGSQDDSVQVAERACARVVEMGSNRGFSQAVNRGIQESRTEWLAIINNDVDPAPDWLEKLVSALRKPDVWFAAGKILRTAQPDWIDGTYDLLSRGACAWRAGAGRKDGPAWNTARPVRFAPFTAALFRAELFQKVGLLDEDFVSYLEDIDFGLRCALSGRRGVYVPDAVAYHEGSATLGVWHKDTVRCMARNQLLLVAKHYSWRCIIRHAWPILVGQLLWGLVATRHGAGLAYVKGKLEGTQQFLSARRAADRRLLAVVLQETEHEIEELQRTTGYDWYWRLYFALT